MNLQNNSIGNGGVIIHNLRESKPEKLNFKNSEDQHFQWKVRYFYIIGNFKNPPVSREQLNKQGATYER